MKKLICVFTCILLIQNIQAQGCSDAGICTLGTGLKKDLKFDLFSCALKHSYGSGEQNVVVQNSQIELSKSILNKSQIILKVPYVFASGNLGKTQGLGDITAVFNRQFYDKNYWVFQYSLGFKLGVNAADKYFNINLPGNNLMRMSLPMAYQTSLGTHDILLGMDARYQSRWRFALGFQMPIVQFLHNNYEASIAQLSPNAGNYFTSNKLMRRPDALLRIDRTLYLQNHLQIKTALISVYHLLHDRVYDANNTASYAVHGSKGLTLNAFLSANYFINKQLELSMYFAQPLIVRKARPEGLTRHYLMGIELKFKIPS